MLPRAHSPCSSSVDSYCWRRAGPGSSRSIAALTVFIFTVFPAPGSLDRYLASIAPLSAVALLSLLSWVPRRLGDSTRRARIARLGAAAVLVVVLTQEAYTLQKIYRRLYHPATWVDGRGRQRTYELYAFDRPWRLHTEALKWLRHQAAPGESSAPAPRTGPI